MEALCTILASLSCTTNKDRLDPKLLPHPAFDTNNMRTGDKYNVSEKDYNIITKALQN